MTHFRDLELKDVPQLVKLSNVELGKNYLTSIQLKELKQNKNVSIIVVEKNEKLIGFRIILSGDFEDMVGYIGEKHRSILSDIQDKGPFLLSKTSVIDKTFQGKGIMTRLINYVNDKLGGHQKTIISIGWKRGNRIPMKSILEKNGFKEFCELKNYWKSDSLKREFICPECGTPSCLCSCVIFVKES